tara:strand:+ start:143 stop:310 length:168 start_codon:yes stop_codon:yes gene_type:complete
MTFNEALNVIVTGRVFFFAEADIILNSNLKIVCVLRNQAISGPLALLLNLKKANY